MIHELTIYHCVAERLPVPNKRFEFEKGELS